MPAENPAENPSHEEVPCAPIPKAKKAKRGPKSDAPKAKRGPARPHRRLAMEIIDTRIAKLQKRLDHAKAQIEDADRHVEGYRKEKLFREEEMSSQDSKEPGQVQASEATMHS